MTVAEMIVELQKYPPDATVWWAGVSNHDEPYEADACIRATSDGPVIDDSGKIWPPAT